MIHSTLDPSKPKDWYFGPWNSPVPIPVGYANKGIDEKHFHKRMFEIYLVASGTSTVVVNEREATLRAGDVLVVEPNEIHSFVESSDDYRHFVVHAPFVKDDKVIVK